MTTVTRLLDALRPERYSLSLDVMLTAFRFEATELIHFTLPRGTTKLTFHATGFKIKDSMLDREHRPVSVVMDEAAQTVTFTFADKLVRGAHALEIEFEGDINESLHGFYRSSYDHDGNKAWLATTQFEAVHAREAFVCIDEPAAKAVFEISITVDEGLSVITNTDPIRELTLESGRARYDFAPTPKMSTYLVAYLIGQFESIETKTAEGVTVRAYATPGKTAQLEFALDVASRTLSFFTDYFGVPYPLSKLDMIAVPDFAAGAMENWGAVTYRETALLLDADNASLSNRQRVAEVVAHELAHQWFGNLVTMAWWNDLWLNEGFATWIEVLAQDHLFPEWESWTQFAATHYATAMDLDGLANTHPIEVTVEDPRQLDEIFDAVSYSKGGSVINMLHQFIGAQAFRDGLNLYLKRHSYGNTTTNDLWKALAEASGQPIQKLMHAWTSQPGYPMVTVKDGQLSQQRFYSSPRELKRAEAATWPLPISTLRADGSKSLPQLISAATAPVPSGEWIKLNPGQTAFYRIRYDHDSLERLHDALRNATISAADRFGIISDLYATTQAGLTTSDMALGVTADLRGEADYVVWSALTGGFVELMHIVEDEPLRERLKAFGRWLVSANLKRLGWDAIEDEPYFDKLMRPQVIAQAIGFDDEPTISVALERFTQRRQHEILADLRPAVYAAVARRGGTEQFDELLTMYREEHIPQERMRLLGALSRFKLPELTRRILDIGFSDEVRAQDLIFVLAWTLTTREARDMAWQTIQDRWPVLLERYGNGGHMLEHIPYYLGIAFSTQAKADDIKAFFAAHPHSSMTRPLAQAIESIELKSDWYRRDREQIEQFLKDSKL